MTMLTPMPDLSKRGRARAQNLSAGPAARPPLDPCRRPEHRHGGYAYPAFRTGDCGSPGWPQSLFTSGRILFFACIGCADEEFARLFPGCPTQHRPYRYSQHVFRSPGDRAGQQVAGCQACRTETVKPL